MFNRTAKCLLLLAAALYSGIALSQYEASATTAASAQPVAGAAGASVGTVDDAQAPVVVRDPPAAPAGAGTADTARATDTPAANAGRAETRRPDAEMPWQPDLFQRYIESATGQRLEHFGHHLFRAAPSTFAPLQDIPVPADYVIGPGDELLIRLNGAVELDARVTVDRNGLIRLPRIGAVPVSGVRVAELEDYLRNRIARLFKNFTLSTSLGQLRSIRIYVMGQARQPGSYVVSSLSTLVSAVFASGGPAPTGSMRAIRLMRNGAQVAEIDLYALLGQGDKSGDTALLPGDVIVVPPAGPRVAVLGAHHHPAIYELRPQGESIAQVLGHGGGQSVATLPQFAMLESVARSPGGKRVIDKVQLARDGSRYLLQDGDILTLLPVSLEFGNAVTLRGNVATPFRYPHHPGMRVSDLFPDSRALLSNSHFQATNALVSHQQGFLRASALEAAPLAGSLAQLLVGTVNWDYATISRLNAETLRPELIAFNLRKAVIDNDPAHDLALRPGDVVTVFSTADMAVPSALETRLVRLEGEVATPGVYQAQPGETLRQLLVRVGGLTPDAYLYGAQFLRESVRAEQQKRWEENLNRLAAEVERIASRQVQESTDTANVSATQTSLHAQRQLVDRLRAIKPEGRIALELPTTGARLADLPDIALEHGDRFVVPRTPPFVTVLGQVYSPGAFLFRGNGRIGDYLDLAGGATRQANRREIHVMHANGTVTSGNRSSWMDAGVLGRAAQPGDTLFVPEELDRFSWRKELKDWTSILYQFGLGAAALKSLTD